MNHYKTIRFIESGYDLTVLDTEEPKDSPNEKIYVAVFNYYGDWSELADKLGATIVDDTLCFTGVTGQEISGLMECNGLDDNYAKSPVEARELDE